MKLQTYSEFNDPVMILWRDEVVDKTDSEKIINNKIVLSEVPSFEHKVSISGYTEISQEYYNRILRIESHQFLVNYTNGIVNFSPSEEGKTVLAESKGKGQILYPAQRIYAHVQDNPDVVKNLQEIINETYNAISGYEEKLKEINVAIVNSKNATNNANTATDNANHAAAETIVAIDDAKEATYKAIVAAASTIMIYKDPVPRYEDIALTYPNPQNGWRVMVETTGNIYRYNGLVWQLTDNWTGGAIPNASDILTGLMTNQDYIYLTNLRTRSMIFVLPIIPDVGVQFPVIKCLHAGTIKKVFSYCTNLGVSSITMLNVQKISKSEFESSIDNWVNVLTEDLRINPNSHISVDGILQSNIVNRDDYFRIWVNQYDSKISGITIQVDIQI